MGYLPNIYNIDKEIERRKEYNIQVSQKNGDFRRKRRGDKKIKKRLCKVCKKPLVRSFREDLDGHYIFCKESDEHYLSRVNKIIALKRKKGELLKTRKYETYLKSEEWKNRRNKYFQKYGKKCERCGSAHYIEIHHASYEVVGKEPDKHLFAFCRDCHSLFHRNYPLKRNMVKETNEFSTRQGTNKGV